MADTDHPALALSQSPPELAPAAGNRARPSSDFPADPSGLPREQLEQHYLEMRRSHVFLSRSRGQLQRRSRELSASRDRFLASLRDYEARLMQLGQEKAETLAIAQAMHRELERFEAKQQALDRLLDDFDQAKDEAGFWSIIRLTDLLKRMRQLLRGRSQD